MLETHFAKAGWDQALGKQVAWLATQQIQTAELRLNPAHLGPIEVKIAMEGEQANILFVSQHGIVREALETALPRLKEALAEQGLDLANADVADHNFSGQEGQGRTADSDTGAHYSEGVMKSGEQGESENVQTSTLQQGMLDLYI